MSDIVELMRAGRVCDDKCRVMEARSGCLCAEAADEIERLRAALAAARPVIRNEVLEEAAMVIDQMPLSHPGNAAETALECAAAIRALITPSSSA